MKYKIQDFILKLMHRFANWLEDIAYIVHVKATYNNWTTCKYCHTENGYGHKPGCKQLKRD